MQINRNTRVTSAGEKEFEITEDTGESIAIYPDGKNRVLIEIEDGDDFASISIHPKYILALRIALTRATGLSDRELVELPETKEVFEVTPKNEMSRAERRRHEKLMKRNRGYREVMQKMGLEKRDHAPGASFGIKVKK